MSDKRCPKCQGAMAQGFTVDATYGGAGVSTWAPGAPVRSVWVGVKLKKQELIPVATFRCSLCGFLESYARSEFGAKKG